MCSLNLQRTYIGRLPWVVGCPSYPVALMALGDAGWPGSARSLQGSLSSQAPWRSGMRIRTWSDCTAPSFVTPSLSTCFRNPTTLRRTRKHCPSIRVLVPGTSGLKARLKKATWGPEANPWMDEAASSPDSSAHPVTWATWDEVLKGAVWVTSSGTFQGYSPIRISLGYLAQKTQKKNGLKPWISHFRLLWFPAVGGRKGCSSNTCFPSTPPSGDIPGCPACFCSCLISRTSSSCCKGGWETAFYQARLRICSQRSMDTSVEN